MKNARELAALALVSALAACIAGCGGAQEPAPAPAPAAGGDKKGYGYEFENDKVSNTDKNAAPPPAAAKEPVAGRLPPDAIQKTVREKFGALRVCYEGGLKKDAKLAGKVIVKFVISEDGTVKEVKDGGSTLPDAAVVDCVKNAFGALKFAAPEGGIVTVTYPIDFSP